MNQKDINNLCNEFDELFDRASATFDMLYQFQENKDAISEASINGSGLIMDSTIESLDSFKKTLNAFRKQVIAS